jgi:hypothetical protein
VFEITHWFLPEYITDRFQQAHVYVRYKVPAAGQEYNVQVHLDPTDANGKALNSPIVSFFISSPPGFPRGTTDGRFHDAIVGVYPVYTQDEVDRGVPHFTSVPETGRFSDERPLPFYIGVPPVIQGWWLFDGVPWFIDTRDEDYCKSHAGPLASAQPAGGKSPKASWNPSDPA